MSAAAFAFSFYPSADRIRTSSGWIQIERAAVAVGIGTSTLLAAVASKQRKILQYVLVADADGTYCFESGDGTAVSGAMSFSATGGAAPPFCPVGQLVSKVGQAFAITTTAAAKGYLVYITE